MKQSSLILALIFMLITSSCAVSKVQVGNYNEVDCKSEVYLKGTDSYVLWELIPIRKTESLVKVKDYEKIVRRSFIDGLGTYGTLGFFSFYTVKIKVKDCDK